MPHIGKKLIWRTGIATMLTTAALAGSAEAERMVAAAHPLAAEAGMAALRNGGSAVDAAIAVQTVLTLVEPQSSGIGGGAFMLHMDGKTGDITAWDGRETAPAAATEKLFLKPDGSPKKFFEAVVGGRSVGAPGVLRMLSEAHKRFGSSPWADGFTAAIHLSEQGFKVTPRLNFLLNRDPFLPKQAVAGRYFYDENGKARPVGYQLKNPKLARTLKTIAADGVNAFYSGPLARRIVAAAQGNRANPGLLTVQDLQNYQAKERPVICRPYRGYSVCGMPPPTSGGVTVLQILGLLRGTGIGEQEPGSADAVHLVAQASRLAYADRALYLADPDFVPQPVDDLLDANYLKYRAKAADIGAGPFPSSPAKAGEMPMKKGHLNLAPAADLAQPSTTHFVIRDDQGNVVSMTSSVENAFGSRLMVGGFLLNNQLTDFSFRPVRDGKQVANRAEAGKRPRSSMSPMIVKNDDGSFRLAVGSPGGSRIIAYVARTLVGVLDWNLPVQTAISMPNFANRNGGTDVELRTDTVALAAKLTGLGHSVKPRVLNSGLHGIEMVDGKLRGGADPRREGVVLHEK